MCLFDHCYVDAIEETRQQLLKKQVEVLRMINNYESFVDGLSYSWAIVLGGVRNNEKDRLW